MVSEDPIVCWGVCGPHIQSLLPVSHESTITGCLLYTRHCALTRKWVSDSGRSGARGGASGEGLRVL